MRLRVALLVLLTGAALALWVASTSEQGERVVAPEGLGVALTVPASWSEIDASEGQEHPFARLFEHALAAPDGLGQIRMFRMFRYGGLDARASSLRAGWRTRARTSWSRRPPRSTAATRASFGTSCSTRVARPTSTSPT